MSRPANPDWTILPFATDSLYEGGPHPWSGTPTKTMPAWFTTGYRPKSGVGAQSINWLFNASFTHDQSAKDAISMPI